MNKGPSTRQVEILEFIEREIRQKGYPPSVREIGEAVGLKSTSTVHGHLSKLERLGLIERDPAKPRAIKLTQSKGTASFDKVAAVPLVTRVSNYPVILPENVEETIVLPRDFVGEGRAFLVKVKDNNMVDNDILEGDYVLIREQESVNVGDLAAVLLDNEIAIRKYDPEIMSRNSVRVVGKVAGLLRHI